MFSKLIYVAPVAFTTAGVAALITLKINDPKLKRILRAIAVVLFFGSIFTIVQQGAEVLERLSRAESTIAIETAKTAAAQAEAKKAYEIAQNAELAAKAATEKARMEQEAALAEAKRQAEVLDQRHREFQEEQQRIQAARRAEQDQKIRQQIEALQRSEAEKKAQLVGWCSSCCTKVINSEFHAVPDIPIGACRDQCERNLTREQIQFGQRHYACVYTGPRPLTGQPIGIAYNSTSPLVITTVKEGGLASEAGVQAGDVILALNGSEVASGNAFKTMADSLPPGSPFLLKVRRGNAALEFAIARWK